MNTKWSPEEHCRVVLTLFEPKDIYFDLAEIAFTDESACCWILHEDISDHILD
jgi:hypothetical protein